jgi:hypothetical protein
MYTVTASSGQTCTTLGSTSCVIGGLINGVPATFTVVATNSIGSSVPTAPSAAINPGGAALAVPAPPAAPTATPYSGAVRISWTPPLDGGAPITGYTVTASNGGATCSVTTTTATPPPLQCDIGGLDPLIPYTFQVSAQNAIGPSALSPPSLPALPALGLGVPPAVPPPAPPAPFVPVPIIDVDLAGLATANIDIPGYVAVPQGRFRIANPAAQNVRIAGGVLAGQFDVVDARAAGPQTVSIGFLETIVQRKFRIVSQTSAGPEKSTAVVQVNQNGAYAVNSWEVQ